MSKPSRVSALLIVTSSVCTVNAISSGIGTIMGGSHLGWISIVIGLANAAAAACLQWAGWPLGRELLLMNGTLLAHLAGVL